MTSGNALLGALGLGSLAYAIYCRRQAGRHHVAGTEVNVVVFAGAQLTPRGRVFRRRYYAALVVGLGLLIAAAAVAPF